MALLPRLALLGALAAACAFAQTPDWKSLDDLPGVDLATLTPAQKVQALEILRSEDCVCGCDMKLAECRVLDPRCRDSRALSSIVVEGVRNRRTAKQIHDELANSPITKMRIEQNRILGDPIKLQTAGSPSRGPANARITLVEFSDFECPYCSLAAAQLDEILKAYPKDVRLVYKQFPLDMHPHAMIAAEASLAAEAQGKFWEMYAKLFANHNRLSREKIFELAKELNLDMARFTREMDSHQYKARIRRDMAEGDNAGLTGTPSMFINSKPYRGGTDMTSIAPYLQAELTGKPVPEPKRAAAAQSAAR